MAPLLPLYSNHFDLCPWILIIVDGGFGCCTVEWLRTGLGVVGACEKVEMITAMSDGWYADGEIKRERER